MKKQTLAALKSSIRHWERLLIGADTYMGPGYCRLCKIFNERHWCAGCPVYEKTGKRWCEGTPYLKASEAHRQGQAATRKELPLIFDELRFLRSLLPERGAK